MNNPVIIRTAVWLGLFGPLGVFSAPTMAAGNTLTSNTQEASTSEVQVSKLITGSRLNQQKTDDVGPVTIITREQILQSGVSQVAELIRNLPFNSFGSSRSQTYSREQGVAQISLRGLGAAYTLVLVDGRRLPKSPANAAANDLNLIPLGNVERIEVFTDGASAIYGSDAVGGVINIITRKDFQGAEIMLGSSHPTLPKKGGESEYGTVIFGTASNRSKLLTGVSWQQQEAVFANNVPWTEVGRSVYGNSFTTLTEEFDDFNWTSLPGACDDLGAGYFTFENSFSLNGTRCAYDFNSPVSEETSVENKALFTHTTHQITDRWAIQFNGLFSQSESFGRYAAAPDSSYFSSPLSVNSPNNPTNPNSPLYDPSLGLDPQAVNWWHRFEPLGNRDVTAITQLVDLKFTVTGEIGNADATFGIRHSNNTHTLVSKNLLLRSAAQAFIETGTYSLQNPYNTSDDVLNAMRFTGFRDARYDQDELFARLAFDLFELKGGTSKMVVGAEYLKEKYFDLADPQSQTEQTVGGLTDLPAFANRTTESLFFETQWPLLDALSLNIAARYENYSDLGDDLSSKIALNFQPMDSLSIHMNYSENHQVANLNMMNNFENTTLTTSRRDLYWCLEFPESCTVTLTEIFKANYSLKSEQSEHLNLRLNYRPKNGMAFSMNLWQIKIKDKIRRFSAQSIINAEYNGSPVPSGLGCIYAPNGSIVRCITGYGNGDTLDISGIDLTAELNYSLFEGQLFHQLLISRMLELEGDDNNDLIGTPGYPKHRAVLTNNYDKENWHIAYNINLIGSQYSESSPNAPAPTWVTQDIQVSYDLPWQGTVAVGAKNITEKRPPIDAGRISDYAYDYNLYNSFGRIVYARYTQTF